MVLEVLGLSRNWMLPVALEPWAELMEVLVVTVCPSLEEQAASEVSVEPEVLVALSHLLLKIPLEFGSQVLEVPEALEAQAEEPEAEKA